MYRWVPAGIIPYTIFHHKVYMHYGDNGISGIEHKFDRDGYSWFKCPDRDILVVPYDSQAPSQGTYDEVFDMNPYSSTSACNRYLKQSLISSDNLLKEKVFSNFFQKNKELELVCDSGGAQLKLGTADYVDPHRIIDVTNRVADIGACLDVPPRPIDQDNSKLIRALAHAQHKNNNIFWDRKRKDLKLLNVIHGFTLEQVRDWAKQVQRDDTYGWAVAPDNQNSQMANLRNLLVAIKEFSDDNYKQFHIFGTGGKVITPVLAWLSKYVPNITTDSTSFLKGLRARKFIAIDLDGGLYNVDMGNNATIVPGNSTQLPCSCEMCSRVRYWEVYSYDANTKSPHLLTWHNMATTCLFVEFWNRIAEISSSAAEFIDYIYRIVGSTGMNKAEYYTRTISSSVKYIECALNEGLEEGDKKFQYDLSEGNAFSLTNVSNPLGDFEEDHKEENKDKEKSSGLNYWMKGSAASFIGKYLGEDELAKFGLKLTG